MFCILAAPHIDSLSSNPPTFKIKTPSDLPFGVTLKLKRKVVGETDFEVIGEGYIADDVIVLSDLANCKKYAYQWEIG